MSATKKKRPAAPTPSNELSLDIDDKSSAGGELVESRVRLPSPVDAVAKSALAAAEKFEIKSAEDYEQAATARANLKAMWDDYEAQRVDLKAPALEAGRKVDAFWQPALGMLEAARKLVTKKMKAWDDEQQRIAEEKAAAERKRLAEEAERKRVHTAKVNAAIQAMQQVVLAVPQTGTLEAVNAARDKLREPLDEELFGDEWLDVAKKTRKACLESLNQLETQIKDRLAAEERAKNASKQAETAKVDAAEERRKRLEAEKARVREEEARKAAEQALAQTQQAAQQQTAQLEQQAASVQAEDTRVAVGGLSRPTTWSWKLVDKSKVKDEYKTIDEKAINAIVRTQKDRAADTVGGIEVFPVTGIRQ